MSMIEKVAWAILKARFYDCEPDMYGHDIEQFQRGMDEEHVEGARHEARAAIEAMREPTYAMVESGYSAEHTLEAMEHMTHEQSCRNIFTAMIDAALREEG